MLRGHLELPHFTGQEAGAQRLNNVLKVIGLKTAEVGVKQDLGLRGPEARSFRQPAQCCRVTPGTKVPAICQQ